VHDLRRLLAAAEGGEGRAESSHAPCSGKRRVGEREALTHARASSLPPVDCARPTSGSGP
jgi:hypothetical protein